jgi:hypothetical protein
MTRLAASVTVKALEQQRGHHPQPVPEQLVVIVVMAVVVSVVVVVPICTPGRVIPVIGPVVGAVVVTIPVRAVVVAVGVPPPVLVTPVIDFSNERFPARVALQGPEVSAARTGGRCRRQGQPCDEDRHKETVRSAHRSSPGLGRLPPVMTGSHREAEPLLDPGPGVQSGALRQAPATAQRRLMALHTSPAVQGSPPRKAW